MSKLLPNFPFNSFLSKKNNNNTNHNYNITIQPQPQTHGTQLKTSINSLKTPHFLQNLISNFTTSYLTPTHKHNQ
jgi:hypothetical protein